MCVAPFSRGGALGRVGGLVLPVGLVGGPGVGGIFKGVEQVGAAWLGSRMIRPKLSVRCEPFATAAAARLPSETAFVGRPPSSPAERASMPKPMKRAPFCCPYQCVSQRPFFGGTDEGRSAPNFGT